MNPRQMLSLLSCLRIETTLVHPWSLGDVYVLMIQRSELKTKILKGGQTSEKAAKDQRHKLEVDATFPRR